MKSILTHITLILLLLCCGRLHAQGVDDAVINSQVYYEGTARSMAMGNATGAMGGDITAMCINPAGLGLYRGSEFTFSTGLQHAFVQSNYYDNSQGAKKMRMSIPNMGLVMGGETSNYKPLRYLQLAIGFTRTDDFNYCSNAYGLNPNSSMVDDYLQTINGIDQLFSPSARPGDYFANNYPYDLSPAWETYLIDRFTDSLGNYYYSSPIPQGNVYQQDEISSRGRKEEWSVAVGTNYYEKLFLGASLGLTHLKRISTRKYTEMPGNENDPNNTFYNWNHIETLGDTAWGVNFKCGVIYYPASWLRIGAAWHTRTLYEFGELWETETSVMLRDSEGQEEYHRYLSPSLYQTYMFRTPHTFVGSAAFFIGRRGMITTDLEYKDYGSSKFDFDGVNDDIREALKPTFNIRIGTEWRWRQYFLRGGAAYYGSPYGFGNDYGSVKKMALGIGYASNEFVSWDFAYELTESTTGYSPYRYYVDGLNIAREVVQHRWRNKLVITLKMQVD